MKRIRPPMWLVLSAMGVMASCATFNATQTDESDESSGTRKITTTIKARTLFDSKTELAKLKATQTEKTQSLGIGALSAESHGTNVVPALDKVVNILQLLRPIP